MLFGYSPFTSLASGPLYPSNSPLPRASTLSTNSMVTFCTIITLQIDFIVSPIVFMYLKSAQDYAGCHSKYGLPRYQGPVCSNRPRDLAGAATAGAESRLLQTIRNAARLEKAERTVRARNLGPLRALKLPSYWPPVWDLQR